MMRRSLGSAFSSRHLSSLQLRSAGKARGSVCVGTFGTLSNNGNVVSKIQNFYDENSLGGRGFHTSPAVCISSDIDKSRDKPLANASEGDDSGENLEERIDKVYDQNMKKLNTQLFSSAETYRSTLPTRLFNGRVLTLYENSFWSEKDELTRAAEHLENNLRYEGKREYVRYMCSPTHTGKTACVLPIFLNSAESDRPQKFSHYFYIACSNNNNRNFASSSMRPLGDEPMVDGGAFIYKALKGLLKNDHSKANMNTSIYDFSEVTSEEDSGEVPYFRDKITELLRRAGIKEGEKVLVHVDEHRKMRRDKTGDDKPPEFRKGAMGTLAHVPDVTVVTTFTAMLDSANKPGSSGTCRYPMYTPTLNIRRVMKKIPDFDVEPCIAGPSNSQTQTMLAGLRFRLAFLFSKFGLSNLSVPIEDNYIKFKADFGNKMRSLVDPSTNRFSNDINALVELTNMCVDETILELLPARTCEHVFALFCGQIESKLEYEETSSMESLMVIEGPTTKMPLLTCRLEYLLSKTPRATAQSKVFYVGQQLFKEQLLSKDRQFLAASPLEAAYAWALSCMSHKEGILQLGRARFVECKKLKGSRLFGRTSDDFFVNCQKLEENVIYYAREFESGVQDYADSHPLCDIFFRTSDNELVVVDVTGGGWQQAREKRRRIHDWIKLHKDELIDEHGLEGVHGVVMAPNANLPDSEVALETIENDTGFTLATLCGSEAVKHLGGLAQVYKWLEEP